jgi:hypothetical protein
MGTNSSSSQLPQEMKLPCWQRDAIQVADFAAGVPVVRIVDRQELLDPLLERPSLIVLNMSLGQGVQYCGCRLHPGWRRQMLCQSHSSWRMATCLDQTRGRKAISCKCFLCEEQDLQAKQGNTWHSKIAALV